MREQKDRYEIFLKVCETGSFSGTAEALMVTGSSPVPRSSFIMSWRMLLSRM